MSAKRAALVDALRAERLEYEDLGIVIARGQVFTSKHRLAMAA